MSTILLGSVASASVFLGLPFGRLHRAFVHRKGFFNGAAGGILLYLLLDLLGHARERPWEVISAARSGAATWPQAIALILIFAGGLAAGWLVAVVVQQLWGDARWIRARATTAGREPGLPEREQNLLTNLLIALSVGLYNFLQGMAIGQAGRWTVQATLIGGIGLLLLGFVLHNAVKGFAIVAPLIGAGMPVAWRYLLALGVVASLPTLPGLILGISYWNPFLFVGFFTTAAGTTLFTLRELLFREPLLQQHRGAVGGVAVGFLVAVIVTLVLEINQYSLPELMSSFWL
ncbi:MAG: hypothetical protein M3220_15125 [Chloroflexota bacterium]|nr:hypothetical protein [Chloroflexota bacterium]